MPPHHWSSPTAALTLALRPIAAAFAVLVALRKRLYDWGILKTQTLPVPVVVVGNVVAGGVGKTPVVIALAQRLLRMGYRPGVISRGYGRQNKACCIVTSQSSAQEVGDEPLLIHKLCGIPVAVASHRVQAATALIAAHPDCNVIISDDGLQHLALGRDIEIVLFDERGVGNHYLMPAGPLREPWPRQPRCPVHLVLSDVPRQLSSHAVSSTGQSYPLSAITRQTTHVLAGIAKPDAFFQMLRDRNLVLTSCTAYPDHKNFISADLADQLATQTNAIWLCTEKDAVKLWQLYPGHAHRILSIPLIVELDATFLSVLDATIQALIRQHTDL